MHTGGLSAMEIIPGILFVFYLIDGFEFAFSLYFITCPVVMSFPIPAARHISKNSPLLGCTMLYVLVHFLL